MEDSLRPSVYTQFAIFELDFELRADEQSRQEKNISGVVPVAHKEEGTKGQVLFQVIRAEGNFLPG